MGQLPPPLAKDNTLGVLSTDEELRLHFFRVGWTYCYGNSIKDQLSFNLVRIMRIDRAISRLD